MTARVMPTSPTRFAEDQHHVLDHFGVPDDSIERSTRPVVAFLCAEAMLALGSQEVDLPVVAQGVLDQIPYDISHLGGAQFIAKTVSHLIRIPLIRDEELHVGGAVNG